jgi:hypothetical protein
MSDGGLVNQNMQPTQYQINKALELLENGDENRTITFNETTAAKVLGKWRIVRFHKKLFIWEDDADSFPHYRLLDMDTFKRICYPEAGGVARSKITDVYELVTAAADDLTSNDHLINFGMEVADATMHPELTGFDAYFPVNHKRCVWNTQSLMWEYGTDDANVMWRSPYPRVRVKLPDTDGYDDSPLPFIMQLAGGDRALYDDIMQSIAPLVMAKKPDGVIWWVGQGANGKSTLMDAIYRIFPGQLASLNVKRLVDGRDTPTLNGKLANVVKESSEGRIEDTEIYKCLGTHENFETHKFHSQESMTIKGNIHSIFSGNSIPVFADKGHSIRRRTFIIPFNQVFESDPDFERKTFTPEFFGRLINEIARYAKRLEKQGYRYIWSAATTGAKELYDREASNAEEYAKTLVNDDHVVAFYNYNPVRMDYENWCAEEGFPPLGIGNLKKAMALVGFERVSNRAENGSVSKIYRLNTVEGNESLQQLGMGRPGLLVRSGYQVTPEPEKPKQTSILNGKW